MKPRFISKSNKAGTSKILQEAEKSRKCKSIRVSPLESRVNTGCMNSPKDSSCPNRNSSEKQSFISRYVAKALGSPITISKKRTVKTAWTHRKSNSEGSAVENLSKKKLSESQEKTIKKSDHLATELIEKTFCREFSKKKLYQTSDSDESIREKLIENIIFSFKTTGSAPATSIDFYKIGKQIGNGAFGQVCIAVHRLTGLKVAIKKIERSFIKDERTRRKIFQEVFIMKKLHHKNIIRLLEVFESNKNVMIVLEYAGGGDLLQIIKTRGRLSESECKGIFFQIIDAIKTCHNTGIIHRDVKLDNILLSTDLTEIKLCDFGVSRFAKPGEKVNEQCGTPAYLAPEIIANQGYEPFFVDIWSMGVLLYAMLSASVPFKAKNLPDLHKLILKCKYDVPGYFSKDARDLIEKMLNPVPHYRISLDAMKEHPWFSDFEANSFVELTNTLTKQNAILKKMTGFGFPREYVIQSLNLKDVNATATYSLLDINDFC